MKRCKESAREGFNLAWTGMTGGGEPWRSCTASNVKTEGSGTGWKAIMTGWSVPVEPKVLCTPPGVNSYMLPLLHPPQTGCPRCQKPFLGTVQPGGKGALHSTRREFINIAAVVIRLKQVSCAVKSQSFGTTQTRGEGALHSARREFINVAAIYICHKQIPRAVKSQSPRADSTRRRRCFALRPA